MGEQQVFLSDKYKDKNNVRVLSNGDSERSSSKNGDLLEVLVEKTLLFYGYRSGKFSDVPCYLRQFNEIQNWYGAQWKVDFCIFHPVKYPNGLLIECKWQSSSGSAEDKLLATLVGLDESDYPSVLSICGKGVRSEIISALRRRSHMRKVEIVEGFDDFLIWAQNNL